MDIDYLLIILPGIIFLGAFGLILIIWHGNFRKKEKIQLNTDHPIKAPPSERFASSRLEPTLNKPNLTQENTNSSVQHDEIDNYIILQLMAPKQRPYRGYELIQTLTSAGFHYGRMNIFHFYSDPLKKELLFSLASAIEPGTFDLNHTGEIVCPGLCLFMPKTKLALAAFDLMWETAQILAQDLGGILCDRHLRPIDDLSHYHSQLHAYA